MTTVLSFFVFVEFKHNRLKLLLLLFFKSYLFEHFA